MVTIKEAERIADFTELPEQVKSLLNELKFHLNGEITLVRRYHYVEDGLSSISLQVESKDVVVTSELEGDISWIQPMEDALTLQYEDTNSRRWDITFQNKTAS